MIYKEDVASHALDIGVLSNHLMVVELRIYVGDYELHYLGPHAVLCEQLLTVYLVLDHPFK